MITASQLQDIVDSFNNDMDSILIEGDLMERSTGRYLLHKDGEVYRVKGIGWGHGHLFVYTEEKGTTGISYEHEVIQWHDTIAVCGACNRGFFIGYMVGRSQGSLDVIREQKKEASE